MQRGWRFREIWEGVTFIIPKFVIFFSVGQIQGNNNIRKRLVLIESMFSIKLFEHHYQFHQMDQMNQTEIHLIHIHTKCLLPGLECNNAFSPSAFILQTYYVYHKELLQINYCTSGIIPSNLCLAPLVLISVSCHNCEIWSSAK